jgi:site-specific DNA-methyltransferase (adenine-specific)
LYDVVARAYAAVSAGWAADRIIADPRRDYEFIRRCWHFGAAASAFELNWALLNARKSGRLSGLSGAERYSMERPTLDQFGFASEFALRALQERYYFDKQLDVSLDRVLCDPRLANEFEELAARIKPGHSSFEYRWAVILLRKARRSTASEVRLRDWFADIGPTDRVRLAEIPPTPGLYWFEAESGPLFVGETQNLRLQVDRHFQATGPTIAPEITAERRPTGVRLALLQVPTGSPSRREQLKGTLLQTLKPRLNYLTGSMRSLLGAA